MKTTELETIRTEILDQLYTNRPDARNAERMHKVARNADAGTFRDFTAKDFATEAEYLTEKGLLKKIRNEVAKAEVSYALTAAGIDHVEQTR